MINKEQSGQAARSLMMSEYQGILSTHSLEAQGYPFGSVTPYCFDRQGRPVIQISRIAQHTKNILADPKVSLLVMERNGDDVQANGRVTYLGQAQQVAPDDKDTIERYYRFFPDARDYHKTHDF
ncbi:MAG: pyridoxamine 5'-phosphate oxidase family protein, partial [Gammaproteobacteria bacterium]|nr:pyridoxamine 5'-phosphate oxidase family protein [Gammaproteobacteria bacterium]